MTIGDVARATGLATSAIRYYERVGLLPRAERAHGRRVYDAAVLPRLAVVSFAQASGFTLREICQLFASGKPYSAAMRQQARAKLEEVDALIVRAETMKALLRMALRCRCVDLDDCGRRVAKLRGN
ncbi:MAG TPA: MerR family transcriptional regulator [Polyangia bacterium]|jgi:DNA-binding transcriptional MerR regulator|nr:MerR family transcriptional regulator [Polyangia bacterium]